MLTLCDTTSILMLIRIAPEMFIDARFQCRTIHSIRNEIIRTWKFSKKYPWRTKYPEKVKCLPSSLATQPERQRYFEAIDKLIENITLNEKTSQSFDLSNVDKEFLSYALANKFRITSGDDNLVDFALQEFKEDFKGNISPLGLINGWMETRLLEWNDKAHIYLADWEKHNEHPQPERQIRKFKKITGRNYPGS